MPTKKLRAPFPWFGGKSRVAGIVWRRFGNVRNYVEPFFGSGAVLLRRPTPPGIETVNDKDCYVANFWRGLQHAPAEVVKWCDSPVNEADLHARHLWLVEQKNFREQMLTKPDYFDAKIAGWWVWGISAWIGSGWCSAASQARKLPRLTGLQGVHRVNNKQRPHLGDSGRGVHRSRPELLSEHRVRREGIEAELYALAERLRRVRVCCGDWKRICGESPTVHVGLTGVFLDPPYSKEADRGEVYSTEDLAVAHEVREWCLANGDNKKLRIALCGYEGEHKMPKNWECVKWSTTGGYGNQNSKGRGAANKVRERIWFSPYCLNPPKTGFF